jgi:hypothetical protein
MKQKKVKLTVILLSAIGLTGVQAQEALPASAGNASGSGGTSSYVIGQVMYVASTGTGGSQAPGVVQPYEISVLTGLEEEKSATIQCSVYPNPANDILTLRIDGEVQEQYIVSLYDINGNLLESKKTEGTETKIDMKNMAPAIYYLKVIQKNSEVRTFKIIKH